MNNGLWEPITNIFQFGIIFFDVQLVKVFFFIIMFFFSIFHLKKEEQMHAETSILNLSRNVNVKLVKVFLFIFFFHSIFHLKKRANACRNIYALANQLQDAT